MTLKKIICKIGTLRGYIFALRNLRRDLHMFLDNIKLRIENNNLNLVKTVLQLWSQIGQKVANFVYKVTLKKKFKKQKTKKLKKYCVTKVNLIL